MNYLGQLNTPDAIAAANYIKELEEAIVYLEEECSEIEGFYDGFVDQFNVTNMRVIQWDWKKAAIEALKYADAAEM